ncbi:MAG: response regulator transcription factor [Clostridiales bacterium]|nr:response regulator transcription factor [Clostridiales bacterium]
MEYQVLIIDDEQEIAESTAEYFNMFDIPTAYATSYEEGMEFLRKYHVQLLLLDINLGERSGFEFCKKIRHQLDIPILFISARTSDDDVLTALNIGGDDYIKKPYTLNVLLAKVKVVLKRYGKAVPESQTISENVLERGNEILELDHNFHQIYVGGSPIKVREMEYQLLTYLVRNKGRVISKEELLDKVWGNHYVGEGTLAVHIRHLREKIEENPNEPKYIKTVWGIGYVFQE